MAIFTRQYFRDGFKYQVIFLGLSRFFWHNFRIPKVCTTTCLCSGFWQSCCVKGKVKPHCTKFKLQMCVFLMFFNLKNSCHVEIINHTFAVFGCFDLFISIIYWLISFGVAVYTHIINEVTYPACRQNAELPKCTFNIKVFFSYTGIWTSCGARADSSNGQPDNTNSKRVQIDDPSSPPSSDPWHATEISKLSYWY